MLAHVFARSHATLTLVQDVILARFLIPKEIDSFLQISNLCW